MDILIFSKDRAMQLDLLLRSIDKFVPNELRGRTIVIFNASNDEYAEGYSKIKPTRSVLFIPDVLGFKNACVAASNIISTDKILVLCDDDVFVRKLPEVDMHFDTYTYSLRLNPYMTYSFNSLCNQTPSNSRKWAWADFQVDYAYPWSVSCSIWRSSEFINHLRELKYNNPNTLEDQLIKNNLGYKYMQCFDENPMLNIPANLVQSTHANKHLGISAQSLNKSFLNGLRINLDPIVGIQSNSPFLNYTYELI